MEAKYICCFREMKVHPGTLGESVIAYCINAEEDIIYISGTNTMDGFKIKLVLLTRINKKLITACYLKYNTVYVKGAKTQ